MERVHHDPGRWLSDLRDELNRAFSQTWPAVVTDESAIATSQWLPAVDIKEEPDRFVLYADIPEVDPKDIDVTMEGGVLSVRGERMPEPKAEGERFTRSERAHGMFYRRFSLPDSADPEAIQARGQHGVLEIVIPKREAQRVRRIAVEG